MGVPKILRRIYSLKGSLAMTPDKMAETYVYCALHPDMEDITGTYISAKNKPVKANRSAYDKETWKKLWEISMKQVGLQ
jgi:hypothetical protein